MFQTHWLSDAVKTVMAQVNNQSYFVRTGTLMTLDGSLDSQIKLEGWTKEYKFRDPADWAPVVVQPRIATADELKTSLGWHENSPIRGIGRSLLPVGKSCMYYRVCVECRYTGGRRR